MTGQKVICFVVTDTQHCNDSNSNYSGTRHIWQRPKEKRRLENIHNVRNGAPNKIARLVSTSFSVH